MKHTKYLAKFCLILPHLLFFSISFSQDSATTSSPMDSSLAVPADSSQLDQPVPAMASVLKRHTDELIAEDVGDFSGLLPGVFPFDLGSIGQFSALSARGFSPQATGLLVDEFALREPIMGFVNPGYGPINLVESISLIGTGRPVPFGLKSRGGAVQINTYRFQGKRPYSRVQFRAGDWGYSDIGLLIGLPVTKSLDVLVTGSRQEFNGFQANAGHEGGKFLSRFSYAPNDALKLEATSILNKNNVEIPAPLLPDFPGVRIDDKRKENRFDQVFSAKVGDLASGRQLSAQVSYSGIRQESISDSVIFDNKDRSLAAALQYDIQRKGSKWTFGGTFNFDDLKSDSLGNHSDLFGQIFAGGDLSFGKQFSLGFQTSVEKRNGFSLAINPSALANWQFSPTAFIWFSAERATRYPSFAERFWPTTFFQGNPAVDMETSTSFEVGLDAERDSKLKLETSVFISAVEDWIGTTPSVATINLPPYFITGDSLAFGVANLGNRTISGVDFKLTLDPSPGRGFGVAGNYWRVKQSELAKQLQVPEYSIYSYVELGRPFFQDYVFIKLRIIGRLLGSRFGRTYFDGVLPTVTQSGTDGLLDARLTMQFSDAKLSLSMENILDRRYQLVPGFFMPPKTFRFAITWEFWD